MKKPNRIPQKTNHRVAVNGIAIHYEDHGQGDPLILLHGGMGTAAFNWGPLIPHFARKYRVIAPDSRGHGKTDNPTGALSYRVMADDLAALIEHLDLTRPLVCGWSDGGQIALELAMNYPDMAGAYAVGGVYRHHSEHHLQMLRMIGIDGPGTVNFDQLHQVAPEYAESWRELHASQGPEYWQDLFRAVSKMWLQPLDYLDEDFARISAPMLVVLGDRDQFIAIEEAVEIYRHLPKGELAIVPHADHTLTRSQPEKFRELVLAFFGGGQAPR